MAVSVVVRATGARELDPPDAAVAVETAIAGDSGDPLAPHAFDQEVAKLGDLAREGTARGIQHDKPTSVHADGRQHAHQVSARDVGLRHEGRQRRDPSAGGGDTTQEEEVSLTPTNVDRVVDEIVRAGGTALGVVCDISDPAQIKASVDKVVAAFGQIDILVNNAFDPSVVTSSVRDLSVEQLQRNLDTGPIAYLRFMQACYPHLKASGAGRIINFASCAGVLGLTPYAPYVMAKEAVRGLTRIAAREWGADKITVNNVLPVADTYENRAGAPPPSTPLARLGSPEEDVAPVVLFLASKDAQVLTGYSLAPDGGMLIDGAR